MGGKGRGSIEDVEHHHTSSYCAKYAPLRNEEQGMKFWFRDAAPCFFAPLLWAQPRIEGKKLVWELFPQLQGWEGAGNWLHWKSCFSSLFLSGLC